MDLIYKIEDWYIYDNMFNLKCRFVASIVPKDFRITDLYHIIKYNESIVIDDVNTNDLIYELLEGTHQPNYNAYSMKWNETKFGIDLTKYNTFYIQPIGEDGKLQAYTSFNICKVSRAKAMREYQLNKLV
jgi:hypothetical protein